MRLILNLLWFILGGFIAGLAWLLGALLLAVTIIGLPWAGAAWRIGLFSLALFGRQVVDRRMVTGREDVGTGAGGLILNIIWFILAGWYIAIAHIGVGVAQCVTIIGIPFGIQHFKLALIALAPIGKTVVEV